MKELTTNHNLKVGIVAISQNYAVGKDGTLPWNYPKDLSWFKLITENNAVVMGRKTYDSFLGEVLPNRLNIVITRKPMLSDHVIYINSVDVFDTLVSYVSCPVFIIGGVEIFSLLSDRIDEWLVTKIPEHINNADKFMPAGFMDNFKKEKEYQLSDVLVCEHLVRRGNVASIELKHIISNALDLL